MGYRPPKKVYKLTFADEDMGGLVVRCRSTALGKLLDITGFLATDVENLTADDLAGLHDVYATFARCLVEWNVEDDAGQPVPATLEGVKSQDASFIQVVIRAWFEAVSGVPAPLETRSPPGGPSLAASLPMEPLSPSHAS